MSDIEYVIRKAIPDEFILDPPDGGDVKTVEGVQRMVARIEQLEAALRELLEYDGGAFCVCDDPYVMDRARAALGEK